MKSPSRMAVAWWGSNGCSRLADRVELLTRFTPPTDTTIQMPSQRAPISGQLWQHAGREMPKQMRRFGMAVPGEVPWGTHFCQFYETQHNLLEVQTCYFHRGLADNERCLWVTSQGSGAEEATAALRQVVPDLQERIGRGQIEFLDYRQWYLRGGQFDANSVLRALLEKESAALAEGYEGLRVAGDMSWLDETHWDAFGKFEADCNDAIGSRRILLLCAYCLDQCPGIVMFDVLRNHPRVLIRRAGNWEVVLSPQQKVTEDALRESEERLQTAAEVARIGTYDYDLVANRLHWSPELKTIWGLRPEDPCPPAENLVHAGTHPDDRAMVARTLRESLDPHGAGLLRIEHRILRPDGAVRLGPGPGTSFLLRRG